jgi:hypothetical protein
MIANANLSQSLSECSHQLALVTEENVRIEQQLDTERDASADAGKSALARRIARRDLSLDDWKQLAPTGTVKYAHPSIPHLKPSMGWASNRMTFQSSVTLSLRRVQ